MHSTKETSDEGELKRRAQNINTKKARHGRAHNFQAMARRSDNVRPVAISKRLPASSAPLRRVSVWGRLPIQARIGNCRWRSALNMALQSSRKDSTFCNFTSQLFSL